MQMPHKAHQEENGHACLTGEILTLRMAAQDTDKKARNGGTASPGTTRQDESPSVSDPAPSEAQDSPGP